MDKKKLLETVRRVIKETISEKKYPVAGEKGYIKVSDLKKGDVLGGSGLEIVSMSTGAKTPSGKIEVTVKDPKTGKELTKLWNKSTTVRLKKEDLSEGRKKTGTKLCARGYAAAKSKFKVFPSAYSNGYGVQVCKGDMPGLDGKKKCSPPYC